MSTKWSLGYLNIDRSFAVQGVGDRAYLPDVTGHTSNES